MVPKKTAAKAPGAKKKESSVLIELPALEIRAMEITLVGDSPLICHKWSEKAKRQMLDKQMKKATQAKEAKDPKKDYEDSLYILSKPKARKKIYGFPTIGFKAAAVDACSHVSNVTKVQARGAFHIDGEFVVIDGTPRPREDMVKIGMGTSDIRYRGEFPEWRTTFKIRFNQNVISPAQIMNLFNTAGFAIGVGDWRPQRDGIYGMFHVEGTKG